MRWAPLFWQMTVRAVQLPRVEGRPSSAEKTRQPPVRIFMTLLRQGFGGRATSFAKASAGEQSPEYCMASAGGDSPKLTHGASADGNGAVTKCSTPTALYCAYAI